MKDETTITLPVSNRAGIVTVEDLLAEIGRRFNTEPVLKSQKLRKCHKSGINHNSLYINT